MLYVTRPLPVTPVQLVRPGIGRNQYCALGDFITACVYACIIHVYVYSYSQLRELWFNDVQCRCTCVPCKLSPVPKQNSTHPPAPASHTPTPTCTVHVHTDIQCTCMTWFMYTYNVQVTRQSANFKAELP